MIPIQCLVIKTVIDPGEFKVWVPTLTELVALLLLLSCYVVSDSFATPWTAACQAPLSMGFPGQEYWSGLPFPSPKAAFSMFPSLDPLQVPFKKSPH